MSPQRLREIEELYHVARERSPEDRADLTQIATVDGAHPHHHPVEIAECLLGPVLEVAVGMGAGDRLAAKAGEFAELLRGEQGTELGELVERTRGVKRHTFDRMAPDFDLR